MTLLISDLIISIILMLFAIAQIVAQDCQPGETKKDGKIELSCVDGQLEPTGCVGADGESVAPGESIADANFKEMCVLENGNIKFSVVDTKCSIGGQEVEPGDEFVLDGVKITCKKTGLKVQPHVSAGGCTDGAGKPRSVGEHWDENGVRSYCNVVKGVPTPVPKACVAANGAVLWKGYPKKIGGKFKKCVDGGDSLTIIELPEEETKCGDHALLTHWVEDGVKKKCRHNDKDGAFEFEEGCIGPGNVELKRGEYFTAENGDVSICQPKGRKVDFRPLTPEEQDKYLGRVGTVEAGEAESNFKRKHLDDDGFLDPLPETTTTESTTALPTTTLDATTSPEETTPPPTDPISSVSPDLSTSETDQTAVTDKTAVTDISKETDSTDQTPLTEVTGLTDQTPVTDISQVTDLTGVTEKTDKTEKTDEPGETTMDFELNKAKDEDVTTDGDFILGDAEDHDFITEVEKTKITTSSGETTIAETTTDRKTTDSQLSSSKTTERDTTGTTGGPCPQGFDLVDGDCTDIDECAVDMSLCSEKERCDNTDGAYQCLCDLGYGRRLSDGACIEVDQCTCWE